MRTLILSSWATFLGVILISCSLRQGPELKLALNPSFSASPKTHSAAAKRTINQVALASHPGPLHILVIAKDPLELRYLRTTRLNTERLWKDLARERQEQALNVPSDPREHSLPLQEGEGYIWGWGTDHAPALKRMAESRVAGKPLLAILITDGHNEDYPWLETEEALRLLFKDGQIRLFVLGVSQQILENSEKLSLMAKWQQMLIAAGAEDLNLNPKASEGFYLSSKPELPLELFYSPWRSRR